MEILNKCPICGGKLYEDSLYQYSIIYEIGKSGKILKGTKKRQDNGPMDSTAIRCENNDFATDYDLDIIEPHDFGEIDIKNDKYYLERY
jgi:hypothetical protein